MTPRLYGNVRGRLSADEPVNYFKKLIAASPVPQIDEIMVPFVQITVNGKIVSSHCPRSWRTAVVGVDGVFFSGSS